MRPSIIAILLLTQGLFAQSTKQPMQLTTIAGISSSWAGEGTGCPNVVNNLSSVSRRNVYHSLWMVSGTGSWTAKLQYSDTSCTGPWTDYAGFASIDQTSSPAIAYANDPVWSPAKYVKILLTGNVVVSYIGQNQLPLSSAVGSVTFPCDVAQGCTGLTSLTAHDMIVGNGTSPPTLVAPGTAGTVWTSNGSGADPSWQGFYDDPGKMLTFNFGKLVTTPLAAPYVAASVAGTQYLAESTALNGDDAIVLRNIGNNSYATIAQGIALTIPATSTITESVALVSAIKNQSSWQVIGTATGSGTTVTWATGIKFTAAMVGKTLTFNGSPYLVDAVASGGLTLTTHTSVGTVSSPANYSMYPGTIGVGGDFYYLADADGADGGAINPLMSDGGKFGTLMTNEFDVNITGTGTLVQGISMSGIFDPSATVAANSAWIRLFSPDAFKINTTHHMPFGLDLYDACCVSGVSFGALNYDATSNYNSQQLLFRSWNGAVQHGMYAYLDYTGNFSMHPDGGSVYWGSGGINGRLQIFNAASDAAKNVDLNTNGTSYIPGPLAIPNIKSSSGVWAVCVSTSGELLSGTSSCGSVGATAWSSLTAPSGNLSLNMGVTSSTLSWTGTLTNDSALNIHTAGLFTQAIYNAPIQITSGTLPSWAPSLGQLEAAINGSCSSTGCEYRANNGFISTMIVPSSSSDWDDAAGNFFIGAGAAGVYSPALKTGALSLINGSTPLGIITTISDVDVRDLGHSYSIAEARGYVQYPTFGNAATATYIGIEAEGISYVQPTTEASFIQVYPMGGTFTGLGAAIGYNHGIWFRPGSVMSSGYAMLIDGAGNASTSGAGSCTGHNNGPTVATCTSTPSGTIRLQGRDGSTNPVPMDIGITAAGIASISASVPIYLNGSAVEASGGSASSVVCWKSDGKTLGYATVAEITSGTCH